MNPSLPSAIDLPAKTPGLSVTVSLAILGQFVVVGWLYQAVRTGHPSRHAEAVVISGIALAVLSATALALLVQRIRLREREMARSIAQAEANDRARDALQRVFDAAPIGIAVTDRDGQLSMINKALDRLLGEPAVAAPNGTIDSLFDQVEFRTELAALRGQLAEDPSNSPEIARAPLQITDAKGAPRTFEVSGQRITGPGDTAIMLSFVDVTDRETNRRRLAQLTQALIVSNEELDQFAHFVSHDLQEPLRKVASFCSLIENHLGPSLDDTGRKYLNFAIDGAERMKRLIADLLTFSRVRWPNKRPGAIRIETAVDRAKELAAHAIVKTNAIIETKALPEIEFHQAPLVQLLEHLIDNAIKFRGDPAPVIQIAADRDHDDAGWRLEVSDNGMGIDDAHRERVFGIFKRLHAREAYEGTGIGLAICKRIVEQRGGRIWIEDSALGGSKFVVTIPDLEVDDETCGAYLSPAFTRL